MYRRKSNGGSVSQHLKVYSSLQTVGSDLRPLDRSTKDAAVSIILTIIKTKMWQLVYIARQNKRVKDNRTHATVSTC